ncbi:MAG: GNAT family N-acetyltransferase [archaeon]
MGEGIRVEELQEEDWEEATKVYAECRRFQTPTNSFSRKDTLGDEFKKAKCRVLKRGERGIRGLVVFNVEGLVHKHIMLHFIGTLDRGGYNGKILLQNLVIYAFEANVKMIYSEVSSIDMGARAFFKKYGFEEYETRESEILGTRIYKIRARTQEVFNKICRVK